ncbi:glycine cleavage system protein GcvH [Methylobrevis albus]|uniref:Glycine cleavage system H protein n=1 Tax=Methylobrevis albus TaxID=2793297 RepID=A0A931MYW0_9HYPH|nr:glycine cleavage system protein GcvH [Methylobrevis albus]MBH0237131.1 glycine cleavage system protein GcvH [Methylobrevis albus]
MPVYFTTDHEWIAVDGDIAMIGITNYAQSALGDVVYVELPAVGKTFAKGDEAAVVESVKAASEVYAAVSGTVTEVNDALVDEPAKVNAAPETDGWFLKLKLADPAELDGLMSRSAYDDYCESL